MQVGEHADTVYSFAVVHHERKEGLQDTLLNAECKFTVACIELGLSNRARTKRSATDLHLLLGLQAHRRPAVWLQRGGGTSGGTAAADFAPGMPLAGGMNSQYKPPADQFFASPVLGAQASCFRGCGCSAAPAIPAQRRRILRPARHRPAAARGRRRPRWDAPPQPRRWTTWTSTTVTMATQR